MTLDETISAGQAAHISDHQKIAAAINTLATVSAVTVVNTVTSSDLAAFTVPAGRLATNGDSLRMTVWGDITNSTGGSVNYTFRAYFGTTAALTSNALGLASSASPRQWRAVIEVARAGSSSQLVSGALTIGNASATNFPSTNTGVVNLGGGTAAENQANALDLKFMVEMGTMSLSANCVARYARYEYLPA